jgi:hypothetical protein
VNECKAWIDADGDLYIGKNETECDWTASAEGIDALRGFFRAEEDERLGRWRYPENPDYVVYPIPGKPDAVRVLIESTSTTGFYYRGESGENSTEDMGRPARAYFDAHRDPKPWHAARKGELWVVIYDGGQEFAYRVITKGGGPTFEYIEGLSSFSVTDSNITSAHRIYPEGEQ